MGEMFLSLIPIGLYQGLVLSLVAIGIMISFRLLNFPDLTAEGAYPLGGALCATLIVANCPAFLAVLLAGLAGGCMGIGTAFIHLRFKVNTLLAGIILSTMIYSINLRVMGKPNVALFEQNILFSGIAEDVFFKIVFLLFINLIVMGVLYWFVHTEKGLRFRAVGLNPLFAQKQGATLSGYIFLGLFAANALSSFAGGLMVQIQQYADISMGIGIVIHALAALMIGESLLGNHTLRRQIAAPFIGALIYQQIQGFALSIGFVPSDLKLITGGIVLLAIGCRRYRLVS